MNGIYQMTYRLGSDGNVAVGFLDEGKVYGGDNSHVFYGSYTITANEFKAHITRKQYGAGYALGGGGDVISVAGTIQGDNIQGTGKIEGVPYLMKGHD